MGGQVEKRRAEIRAMAAAANIDERTLLATDYLNHFNEVVMLIGMVPDMPECLDDVMNWRPKSYPEHFRDTNFSAKELAIEAYEHSPAEFREPFDNTVEQADGIVQSSRARMIQLMEEQKLEELGDYAMNVSAGLQKLIDVASAVIHGSTELMAQNDIDILLQADPPSTSHEPAMSQDDIDNMF